MPHRFLSFNDLGSVILLVNQGIMHVYWLGGVKNKTKTSQ